MPFGAPVWDDGRWLSLSTLDSRLSTDVCVIGLGGSGLSAILELLRLGKHVVGIDAGSVGGGAAGRNGGILRAGLRVPHHEAVATFGRERALRLYRLTAAEIGRIDRETPDLVRRTGSLRLAEDDTELEDCHRQLEAMLVDGIEAELYDGPLGRGVFAPGNGAIDPLARCRALARLAGTNGAQLFENTRAVEIIEGHVVAGSARVDCDAIIVAVDGRLEEMLPLLKGVVRSARLQMLATAPDPGVVLPCPISFSRGFDYAQQLPDGRIAIGGGRHVQMEGEWTTSAEPTELIQSYLERTLRERLRVTAPITHRWAATVSYTTSGLPLLTQAQPGVWVTGAYSGTGNLMGAICGRAAAHLATGGESELEHLLAQPGAAV